MLSVCSAARAIAEHDPLECEYAYYLVSTRALARATITINECLYERVRELVTNEIDVSAADAVVAYDDDVVVERAPLPFIVNTYYY